MNLTTIRDHFPGLKDKVFLDAACVSLTSREASAAIEDFLEMALLCHERSSTLHHIAMDNMRGAARKEVALFLDAHEDEIALVESTSHGLSIAVDSIPLKRGDHVLLCDLEFLEVAVPWVQMRDRVGLQIDVVRNREGRILAEDVASAIRPETKVVAISSVQWSNGFRCDLDAISKICRERGVWLVVDAIQQLGTIPISVRETSVDILACGGHKWLNAPFGQGFLYIRREILPKLKPTLAGYLSVAPPEGGWGNYFQTPSITPVRDYDFVNEARRFETGGTSNYPGAAGLAASLKMIQELGQNKIAEKVVGLTSRLIAGLEAIDVHVVTPKEEKHRSGIVTLSVGSSQDNLTLMEHLLDHKILVSVRYTSGIGGVRVSSHFYNSDSDIDRLLNTIEDFHRTHKASV